MRHYGIFAVKRLVQLLAVIVCGCSIAFFIAHLSPISPVEQILARVTGKSNFDPNSIIELRRTLTELFGLDVPLHEQYLHFLSRLPSFDFGPSLMAFPTPATTLVMLALPWTVGLLTFSVVITWLRRYRQPPPGPASGRIDLLTRSVSGKPPEITSRFRIKVRGDECSIQSVSREFSGNLIARVQNVKGKCWTYGGPARW